MAHTKDRQTVKVALPTGDWRNHVIGLLDRAAVNAPGYEPGGRVLRTIDEETGTVFRVFRERDIPVQLALGNYDLGICSEVYLEESSIRFPLQAITRIGSIEGGVSEVWVAAAPDSGLREGVLPAPAELAGVRIASQFPALAEWFAASARIPGYRLLPLAGSADAYPPEDTDLVVVEVAGPEEIRAQGLLPLACLFRGGLALVANSAALARHDLSGLLSSFRGLLVDREPRRFPLGTDASATFQRSARRTDVARLAVPDGHAQRHTPAALADAGLVFDGYSEKSDSRRPLSDVDGLEVKVVRPQDMPQLVALGAFDAGITGIDVLTEFLIRFPAAPVGMAVDLRRNWYRIGPVVDQAFPADTVAEALPIWNALDRPVRIASEFPALAEQFARDNHLHYTTIMPINGASEGFVPEDADILIEGTETGSSLRANHLKMLDTFIESTACLIVRTEPATTRTDVVDWLVERLAASVPATE